MRINRNLNLVIPVERDDSTIYFHSTPISREVFEGSYRLIAAAHAEIFGAGGAYAVNGVRVAALTLRSIGRKIAEDAGREEDAGASPLLGEIKRLTSVIAPSGTSWETLPVDTAIQRDLVDSEEWSEVENAVAFFTLVWWMTPVRERATATAETAGLMGLSTTSSSPTEWIASLRTSTAEQPTQATISSIPS